MAAGQHLMIFEHYLPGTVVGAADTKMDMVQPLEFSVEKKVSRL